MAGLQPLTQLSDRTKKLVENMFTYLGTLNEEQICSRLENFIGEESQENVIVRLQPLITAESVVTPFGTEKLDHSNTLKIPQTISMKRTNPLKSTPYQKNSKGTLAAQLTKICIEKRIYRANRFMEAARKDPAVQAFYIEHGAKINFEKILEGAAAVAYNTIKTADLTYKERMDNITVILPDDDKNWLEWKAFIDETMGPLHMQMMLRCVNLELGKRKTIYMVGKAGGGKTAIIRLFTSVFDKSEIGKANSQSLNSAFWLEDLANKRVYVLDEILATEANVDSLKMVMEGNDQLATDRKHKGKWELEPRPVFIGCNNSICRNVQGHTEALRDRCVSFQFTKKTDRKLYLDNEDSKLVMKKVWDYYHNYIEVTKF